MQARQAVITKPFETAVREVELPPPASNQILVQTEVSAQSPERILSELERLGALRLAGVLSQHEFERAKRLLLETSEAA